MFDETKVYESDYDVPACSDNTFLFEDFGFENQHFGWFEIKINGQWKMKSNLNNNYYSYFYLFIGTATTSWLGPSYEIFSKDVYDTSNYSQVSKKINKCFIGTYWSDVI